MPDRPAAGPDRTNVIAYPVPNRLGLREPIKVVRRCWCGRKASRMVDSNGYNCAEHD